MLTIVPTPIGNLADITFRAIECLKNADRILAEDTRVSGKLLKHYSISTPMTSFHSYNEHQKVEQLISELKSGKEFALISDAGTPGISDPGFLIVRECIQQQIEVECLPGATAFVPALVISGLPTDRFFFQGFLPRKKGRKTCLENLSTLTCTVVIYESPYRVVKSLQDLLQYFGNRPASASRELSKKFEQTVRGSIEDLIQHFSNQEPKGEFVICIGAE